MVGWLCLGLVILVVVLVVAASVSTERYWKRERRRLQALPSLLEGCDLSFDEFDRSLDPMLESSLYVAAVRGGYEYESDESQGRVCGVYDRQLIVGSAWYVVDGPLFWMLLLAGQRSGSGGSLLISHVDWHAELDLEPTSVVTVAEDHPFNRAFHLLSPDNASAQVTLDASDRQFLLGHSSVFWSLEMTPGHAVVAACLPANADELRQLLDFFAACLRRFDGF